MAGTMVLVWLLASVVAYLPVRSISAQIQRSYIVGHVAGLLPPVPAELSSVEQFLTHDGFPVNVFQYGFAAPVKLPSAGFVDRAVAQDGSSTVRVVAYGCDHGDLVEKGSGFVAARQLVVTNAHVVAGAAHIVVRDEVGDFQATPVLFDPRFDLAVLRVPGITDRPLAMDSGFVGRGTRSVVLGYPGGGPFNAQPAGVLARIDPTTYDIYGQVDVTRQLYELQALVRPGNSGGPLVEGGGQVIGVVFSRSTTDNRTGFALTSPGVLKRLRDAERRPAGYVASTESCTGG
jgi:S1-C subfamily serine protease